MLTLVVTVLVASLVGSLHCAGMCGAFVAFCMGDCARTPGAHLAVQTAYHGGRLTTYSLLGAVAGALGAALDLGGAVFGLQRVAMIGAGLAMVAFGVIAILRQRGVRIPRAPIPAPLRTIVARGQRVAMNRSPVVRAGIIGLLTTFLPCGWLYAFAIIAAGTGNAATGALTMAVFWLGTVPILASIGVGVQTLAGPLKRVIPTLSALAMVIVGVTSLFGRFNLPALAADGATPTTLAEAQAAAEHVGEEPLPCCAGHE